VKVWRKILSFKSVVINLGTGDLRRGLPRVTVQVWADDDRSRPEQFIGSLPAAPGLVDFYRDWRSLYQCLCDRHLLRSIGGITDGITDESIDDLEIDHSGITNVSQVSFEQLSQSFQDALNSWLRSETFLPIERQLRSQFNPTDEVRLVIATDDELLRRLPWNRWDFFNDYPKAEMALSCAEYQFRAATTRGPRTKARILAVLGNSQGIDLAEEAQFLQALPEAETQFLVNPSRQAFNQALWDDRGWDLFFFAGHSQTEGETGRIYLNENSPHNSLTIEQFAAAIEGAVSRGLALAIFNSCDGLGLAKALSALHIPQVIVMREPVANRVAQDFFKHFLTAFAKQNLPLYLALRQARLQLQGLEDEFPGASWLPILCQNPAVEPANWKDWVGEVVNQNDRRWRDWGTIALISVASTAFVLGIRYGGALQAWELQAFDQFMRLRSPEPQDDRILIVAITEEDLRLPEQAQRKGSLSDVALVKLLTILNPLKPRSIGLDIYRDFPFGTDEKRVRKAPQPPILGEQEKRGLMGSNFFAICKVGDPEADFPEIAPLPNLPIDRQGFSDVVTDGDQVLRRHLLFMDRVPGAACGTPYALSTQLAFHYLEAGGISPRYTVEDNLQLGNQVFQRLQNHHGSYHQADTGGNQIMLNYRFTQASLSPSPIVSLKDVLAGRLKAEDVRDRIILIGVTAPSSKDVLATPYGQRIPGVYLQAQMVSQLLSAVKDGRRPIGVWDWQIGILWIWGWGIMGGVLVWRCRSVPRVLGLQGAAIGTLVPLGIYGLTQSLWVPVVPAAIGFLITSGGMRLMMTNRK
jgi:CHASE2 domain-containing sensor protein